MQENWYGMDNEVGDLTMKKGSQLAALTICGLIVIVVGTLFVGPSLSQRKQPDLSRYVLTKPQVLFSLQYGEGPSQVGMFIPHPTAEDAGEPMGPSDFVIGFDGSIYIGDAQNGKIKKFSRNGKLLMVTESPYGIVSIAVDKKGWIYVIHGTLSDQVAVYDEKGRRVVKAERKIMGAAERLRKELESTQPQLAEFVFESSRGLPAGEVRCDADGNLYFLKGIQSVVKIDSDFKRAQVVKGYPYAWSSKFLYSYRLLFPEKEVEALIYRVDGSLGNRVLIGALQRAEVTIYRADGSVMRRFTLPKGEWSEVEKLLPIGISDIFCDGRGHFYTSWSPISTYHIPLRSDNPEFFAISYGAVLEYDKNGDFVGVRAIINVPPCNMVSWFKVDAEANIYWLDFKADHVNVMMAPVPQ